MLFGDFSELRLAQFKLGCRDTHTHLPGASKPAQEELNEMSKSFVIIGIPAFFCVQDFWLCWELVTTGFLAGS